MNSSAPSIFSGEQPFVQHVGDPDTDARDLVLIAGSDAAAGGADLLAARVPLDDLVHRDVIGHQQMCIGRYQQPLGVHAAVFQTLQLGEQHTGSTTTPLPMTFVTPGVRMPDGIR